MLRRTLLWASENRWLRERGTRFALARRGVRRFMPGERLDDALSAAEAFVAERIGCVLTELGENVADPAAADATAERYRRILDSVAERSLDAEISVKLTQLGLDLDAERTLGHVRTLAATARSAADPDETVWIDMEGSAYTGATIELYRNAQSDAGNLGLCLQAYLHRTGADLDSLLPLRPAIRLVKGAYAEPAAVALTARREIDEAYLGLAVRLLEARAEGAVTRVAYATHDGALIERIRAEAGRLGVPEHELEFQMLYGICRDDQRRLAAEGCRVRVLISFGEAWYPWFVRRLAEKPSNLLLVASR